MSLLLSTIICHLFTNKSVLLRAVGSSTICQETEESCPPMYQVMDIETLFLALGLEVVHELAPDLLGHSLGVPEKYYLRQSLRTRELLEKSRFPVEIFQHTIQTKKYKSGCIGEGKGNILTLSTLQLPQGSIA